MPLALSLFLGAAAFQCLSSWAWAAAALTLVACGGGSMEEAGAKVIVATKLRHGDANTMMAEGGIQAASKGHKDSPYYHYLDVLGGGVHGIGYLANEVGLRCGVAIIPEGLIEFIPDFKALIAELNDELVTLEKELETLVSQPLPVTNTDLINLKVVSTGNYFSFYYATNGGEWNLLKKNIDAFYLSTAQSYGFTGTTIGLYASCKTYEFTN